MDQISDLQAQIVALRLAVEGAWLSLLHADQDPVAAAARLKDANVAAVRQMIAQDDVQRAAQAAVIHHTEQLWGSVGWQLEQNRAEPTI